MWKKLVPAVLLLFVVVFAGCDLVEETGIVTGVVTDEATGDPLEGVQVQIGTRTDNTDGDGEYTLTDVPAGEQAIQAQKDGYATYSATINVLQDETKTYNIEMESSPSKMRDIMGKIMAQGEAMVDYMENIDEDYFEALGQAYLEEFNKYSLFLLAHLELLFITNFIFELEPGEYELTGDPIDGYEIVPGLVALEEKEYGVWTFQVNDFFQFTISIDEEFFAAGPDGEKILSDFDIDEPTFKLEVETLSDDFPEWIEEILEQLLTPEELDDFQKEDTDYNGQFEIDGEFPPSDPEDIQDLAFILNINGQDSFLEELEINGRLQINKFRIVEDGSQNSLEIDIEHLGEMSSPSLSFASGFKFNLDIFEDSDEEIGELEMKLDTAYMELNTPLISYNGSLDMHIKVMEDWSDDYLFAFWPLKIVSSGGFSHPDPYGLGDIELQGDFSLLLDEGEFDSSDYFGPNNVPHIDELEFGGRIKLPEADEFQGSISLKESNFLYCEEYDEIIADEVLFAFYSKLGPEEIEGTFSIDFDVNQEKVTFDLEIDGVAGEITGYSLVLNVVYDDDVEATGGVFDPEDVQIGEFFVEDDWLKLEWIDGEIDTLLPL